MLMMDLRKFFYEGLRDRKIYFYYKGRYRTSKRSFYEIITLSLKFASFLKASGLEKGGRVLLRTRNNTEWVIVFVGCVMYGAALVPLDYRSDVNFVKKVMDDVEPGIFIDSKENDSTAGKSINNSGLIKIYIEEIESLISPMGEFDPMQTDIDEDDTVQIIYTSGTTSAPKGVVLTYKNIQSNIEMALPVIEKWKKFLKLIPSSRLLSVVPLSHMYGQVAGLFIPVALKLPVFFISGFEPRDIIGTIKRERIIALAALPQQLKILKDHIVTAFGLDTEKFKKIYEKFKKKRWWIRYIRFMALHIKIGITLAGIISGGARMREDIDDFYRTIAFGIFQGYGLTETAPLVALFDPSKNKAGSVGSFLDSENVKIEKGELYIRGNSVTPGYFKDSKKTKEHFKNGWFRTGDAVEVDQAGNVYIKGRKDEVIVKENGVNVYPSDITIEFRKLPEIKDCAVFGMETDGGIEIIAVLLLKDNTLEPSRIDKIVSTANSNLNVDQKVDDYLIWEEDDFPRTKTMNIKKGEILKRIQGSVEGRIVSAVSKGEKKDVYDLIKKIKRISGGKDREASLEKDLGMDSLDIISLSAEIERNYGIDSSLLDINKETKIRDIEEKIKNPPKKTARLPFFGFAYNRLFIVFRIIFQYLIFPFIRILYRVEVIGRENLKNIELPTSFVSNHVSVMDTLVILFSMPLMLRKKITVVMSIGHHFSNFFSGKGCILRRFIEAVGFYLFIILYVNVIPLSREFAFEQVFKNIGRALDRGWNILIFPEGNVTTDGRIHEFEPGIGIIGKDMKVPVIPLRIDGLYNILRNGILPLGHVPRIPLVKVYIGKQKYYDKGDYREIGRELYRIIKDELGSYNIKDR
jgi:long-chain acyl-CoA synthetase